MKLTIRRPDDMHVHLRDGDMLDQVLHHTQKNFARALVMPNLVPPILNAEDLSAYRERILKSCQRNTESFQPLMTFKVTQSTTPEMIGDLKLAGAAAGKLYPEGVTTNSENGVTDFEALYPVYEAMATNGVVLCIHGELPGTPSLEREVRFLPQLIKIARHFPNLKIVFEHISSFESVTAVAALPKNVAATITAHHLYLTLDDIIGGSLDCHSFCKPVAKTEEDRQALIRAATSGNPKFFLGSDSAPHSIEKKHSEGCAGVFSAPVLLPALAQKFAEHDSLDRLDDFCGRFGADFYGLPLNTDSITLSDENGSWVVPPAFVMPFPDGRYGSPVKPFLSGKTLNWKVVPNEPKNQVKIGSLTERLKYGEF